jgi:phytoene synthase
MDKAGQRNGVNFLLTTFSWPPDVALALNYGGADMVALMRFDRTLAATVAGAKDPALAQLRLAWWRTQLEAPVAGNDGSDAIRRFGVRLLPVIDGWERLLASPPLNAPELTAYGEGRGSLFALLEGDRRAGAGWALADFARHCSDPTTRDLARGMADHLLRGRPRQPKPLRVLANLARAHHITRWTLLRVALS